MLGRSLALSRSPCLTPQTYHPDRGSTTIPPLPELLAQELLGVEAVTSSELHDKFIADGETFTLSYAGLSTFYSGLAGLVGVPSSNLLAAVRKEHCESPDSQDYFEVSHYRAACFLLPAFYFPNSHLPPATSRLPPSASHPSITTSHLTTAHFLIYSSALSTCELRVVSCELRVASCELRVSYCELRVAYCCPVLRTPHSPYSLLPTSYSSLPTPYSLLPAPYSLLTIHYSLLVAS